MEMTDMTDSKVLSVRRTIYLTIMSRSETSISSSKKVKHPA